MTGSVLADHSVALAQAASTHHAPTPLSFLHLGRILSVALWTGGIWQGGVLVLLLFGLALLGMASTPMVLRWGRRHERW